MSMRDRRARSLAKSITWRVSGVVILWIIAWALTGDVGQTSAITIVFHAIRVILYYFHERIWERVKWGRKR